MLSFLFLSFGLYGQEKKYVTVERAEPLMDSQFLITIVADTEARANKYIDETVAEIRRIEKLISSWDANSETSLINKYAGIKPVQVSPELFNLIERAILLSEVTNGAFDITIASIDQLWRFDGTMQNFPTKAEIKNSIKNVGSDHIVLDAEKSTVFLKDKGVKISFGAIGKGFAADKAKALMQSKQVFAGFINASGDITAWGRQATGEKWIVGIAKPIEREKIISWLPLEDSSIATSGNFEKYVSFNGEKYSHIVDPRTGFPTKGINSVSVFSKSAEQSDALATAIFVLGIDNGLALINKLLDTEVIIVDANNVMHKSKGLKFDYD